ncbi:MAG TPA: peroxide stress protein YaaA [Methylibium sp.]|nr:peroxide stress protein YaaA [Methylibium sp.]
MLLLLSPAKTLDYERPLPPLAPSTPKYAARALELVGVLREQDAGGIAALMDLSPALAELNVGRYRDFSARHTARNSRPAVYAFDGDVYGGLDAASLDAADIAWAQEHLAILSGLYGVLRPLDRMQPYRLEMGTRLANARGKDLYAYWGSEIAHHLDARLRGDPAPLVVNLASEEYFKVVDRRALRAPLLHCVFEDWKGGAWKIISFHAKRARGLMARHAIRSRATTVADLCSFAAEGYAHDAAASEPGRLVFRRRIDGRLAAETP